jgi:hypothetical protein
MTIEYTDPAATNAHSGERPVKAAVRVFSDTGADEESIIETPVEMADDDAPDHSSFSSGKPQRPATHRAIDRD